MVPSDSIRTHVRTIRAVAIHYLKEVPVVTVHHELAAGQVVAGLSLADLDAVVDGLLAGVAALSGSQASARLADVSRSAAKLSAYRVALVAKIQASRGCQMVCVRGWS